jgi:hypothetical protein
MSRYALLPRGIRSLVARLAAGLAGGATSRALAAGVAALLLVTTGAAPARANDLSGSPCTAGDVEIVGNGIVINEPCICPASGTFNATVEFTVRNNTGTPRYCISLHLVPDGVVATQAFDVILVDVNGSSNAPGKSGNQKYRDTIMRGTILNYPCNAGVTCFGEAGVVKGKCAPNSCTTVSWNTSPGAAGCTKADENPPGGQCRHQQVCVVGYGASLACISGCIVNCGGSSTLRATVQAPAARGPFTFKLDGSDGSTQTQSAYGDASGSKDLDFTVNPTQSPSTTFTLTITDNAGCSRTATASVSVNSVSATITAPATPGCNGILSYSASVSGFSGCTFTWKVDGQTLAAFLAAEAADAACVAKASGTSGEMLDFRDLDNTCHTIEVTASCANGTQTPCSARASTTVKQCVTPTLGCPVQ